MCTPSLVAALLRAGHVASLVLTAALQPSLLGRLPRCRYYVRLHVVLVLVMVVFVRPGCAARPLRRDRRVRVVGLKVRGRAGTASRRGMADVAPVSPPITPTSLLPASSAATFDRWSGHSEDGTSPCPALPLADASDPAAMIQMHRAKSFSVRQPGHVLVATVSRTALP